MRADVDFEAQTIHVGVRELVEPTRQSARGVGMLPLLRAELGQEVHKRYRQEREGHVPGFRAEVTVAMERVVDGFTAHIRGRADGVLTEPGVTVIEEVKSMALSAREIWHLTPDSLTEYSLQARMYALALARPRPDHEKLAQVQARLLIVSILDGSQRTLDVDFSVDAAEYALVGLLRRVLAEAREARARAQRRAACADKLVFPYPTMRPHQAELSTDMERGLGDGRPVLAWAPTGIGKTVSALLSGLRFALSHGTGLFFSTAKNTQQELVARTFEDIARASDASAADISAVTLRAKERMCPPGDLMCHPDVCTYLNDFSRRARSSEAIPQLISERRHVTPDDIYEYGQRVFLCPFELSLQVAAQAELVIADYNYVYDAGIALSPFSTEEEDESVAVVVDEGHNLLERARGYYSAFVGKRAIAEVRARVQQGVYLASARGRKRGDRRRRDQRGDHRRRDRERHPNEPRAARAEPQAPRRSLPMAKFPLAPSQQSQQLIMTGLNAHATIAAVVDPARHGDGGTTGAPAGPRLFADILTLCQQLDQFIDATLAHAHDDQRGFVDDCTPMADHRDGDTWAALAAQAVACLLAFALHCRLHKLVFPRDPLPELLREVVRMRDGILCEEPELIPYVAGPRAQHGAGLGVMCVNPARRLAGRHKRALGTVLMSATLTPLPFYAEVLGFAGMDPILSTSRSPFPGRHRDVLIVPSVDTTYRRRGQYTTDIARLIEDIVAARPGRYMAFFSSFAFLSQVAQRMTLPRSQVLMQLPAMPQALRESTLARLRESRGPMLLLAVTGGVFAEGIDLPGEQLIGAIVVGPSLPPIGFERALMREYHDQRGDDGFAYAMLYPGMQRVIQSAGRVIRTMTDRGVIALLGSRFATPQYARLLPPDWYERNIGEMVTTAPRSRLTHFWTAQKRESPVET